MDIQKTNLASRGRNLMLRMLYLVFAASMALIALSPCGSVRAATTWTPMIDLEGVYDDNVDFARSETKDDYIYIISPALQLNYNYERTKISARGGVDFRRYVDEDDLDDEVYRFNFRGEQKFTERSTLIAEYRFIEDSTLDSEVLETGRVSSREDRTSHYAMMAPSFYLTERMKIGLLGHYDWVSYDSDAYVDYSAWDINLPLGWDLATQVDTVYIIPGYAYRDSDTGTSESLTFRLGWDHEVTERLIIKMSAGARYTEHESSLDDETERNWGGLADLKITYFFQTASFSIEIRHDLRNTAEGALVEVTRVMPRWIWNFTERAGMVLEGWYYYTDGEESAFEETTEYYRGGAELFYNLTKNHSIFVAYDYSQNYWHDIEDEPRAERNRIWAGIRLKFPIQ